MILKSELSSKHTFKAMNSYDIPALLYGFPVLDWTITELEIIDRETQKMLQQYYAIHGQSGVTRLYLPRKNGDRRLVNITNHYKNVIINFSSYLLNSEEQFLKLTSNWQVAQGEKSIHQKVERYCDEIDHDQVTKTANAIEVAVPNNCNVCNKRLQKIRAYANLSGEIKTL